MARYRVTGPDGVKYEVTAPDSASEQDVIAFVSSNAPKADAPKPQRSPVEEKAFSEVSAYRKQHPTYTAINDKIRQFTRGTPVGSWLDEGNAMISSVLPSALGGRPYDEEMAVQKAMDTLADEESSTVASLPIVGDVTTGGIAKLAGGIASAGIFPWMTPGANAPLLAKVGAGAATGAGYGAFYGSGESDGGRASNALTGGLLGGLLGTVAPAVGAGVANAYEAARTATAPLPQALAGVSRPAANRLADITSMDDVLLQDVRRNGPQGMLADAGPNLRAATEGIAQQPGAQSRIISEALTQRAEGAPGRLRATLDREMGAPANMPATLEATRQHYSQQARPFYDQFYNASIKPDEELVAILHAVPNSVWPKVAEKLQMERMDPNALYNTGRGLDLIKRSLDDAARGAGRGTDDERLYSGLARDLRTHVDNILSPGTPQNSPWAQGRAIAGEGFDVRDGFEVGQGVFSRRVDPQQLAADMNGMSLAGQEAVRIGARDDLRRTMGRAATNFRTNGDAAARRQLNSDFAQENLQQIVGPNAARNISRDVQAENRMAETANQVMSNSATARRQAVRDIIPRQVDSVNSAELRGASLFGTALEVAKKLGNALTRDAVNARNERMARDMADMLVAQGGARDQIASGLLSLRQQRGITRAQRLRIERIANHVLRGSSAPAISGATAN